MVKNSKIRTIQLQVQYGQRLKIKIRTFEIQDQHLYPISTARPSWIWAQKLKFGPSSSTCIQLKFVLPYPNKNGLTGPLSGPYF